MSPPEKRRGKSPVSPARLRHTERKAQALQLRLDGLSSPAIAAQMGVARETVWRLLTEALAERSQEVSEKTEMLRALEAERYEQYIAQLRPLALAGDLGAHRALLRWHERLAKLLALDLQRDVEVQEPVVFVVDMRTPDQRGDGDDAGVVEVAEVEDVPPLALEAGAEASGPEQLDDPQPEVEGGEPEEAE